MSCFPFWKRTSSFFPLNSLPGFTSSPFRAALLEVLLRLGAPRSPRTRFTKPVTPMPVLPQARPLQQAQHRRTPPAPGPAPAPCAFHRLQRSDGSHAAAWFGTAVRSAAAPCFSVDTVTPADFYGILQFLKSVNTDPHPRSP